jgi:phosphoribosyl 1,2-cyclic phosphodiesterase
MRVKVWGARGSVASPGPETTRYGGNTSCVQVTLEDGTMIVLDAGTGIRGLGLALARQPSLPTVIHILLTHLHLDHIQGLMFFAPCYARQARIVIWGPEAPEASLEERVARYISAPLSPLEVRELPCDLSFLDCPGTDWEIGGARIRSAPVTHRGPTLGYRITEGDVSLCYIPDHEPGLGMPIEQLEPEWMSGYDLAAGASLLIHDCQYTDEEYPEHIGWGHSALTDTLFFARRAGCRRVLLFHHDPLHDDRMLDALRRDAIRRWADLGGDPREIELAVEGTELSLKRAGGRWRAAPRAGADRQSPAEEAGVAEESRSKASSTVR